MGKVKKPIYIDCDELSKDARRDIQAANYGDCWAFPRTFRQRFECAIWMLVDMLDKSNMGELLEIDEALTVELKRLSASLSYLANSTSMAKGKYFDFDKAEINQKLGRKL